MPKMIRHLMVMGSMLFAILYLAFPSIIPDFIPLVGWVDEGLAMVILLSALRFYGIDFAKLYGRSDDEEQPRKNTVQSTARPVTYQDNIPTH